MNIKLILEDKNILENKQITQLINRAFYIQSGLLDCKFIQKCIYNTIYKEILINVYSIFELKEMKKL